MQTMTLSPASIMWKSSMAFPTPPPLVSPLPCLDANAHFAVVKNLQLGQLAAPAAHAGQLHQAVGQLADQAFEQVDMPGRAFVNDDLAHAAVVEHMADVV